MNAYDARKKGNADELHRQLVNPANGQNKSKDAGTLTPATFMRATIFV